MALKTKNLLAFPPKRNIIGLPKNVDGIFIRVRLKKTDLLKIADKKRLVKPLLYGNSYL